MVIYLISLYTIVGVFSGSADNDFNIGGEHDNLLDTGDFDQSIFEKMIYVSDDNMTTSQKWEYMNNTYGDYQGLLPTFNWLDTGWYHVWRDSNGYEEKMIDWKWDKWMNDELDADDVSFQESAGNVLSSIWDGLGYVGGLLIMDNIITTMSDGSEIPDFLVFVPVLMVLIPWIFIILWIFPYAIKLLRAIGGLIPFT